MSEIKIAPSILSADFSKLGEQVEEAVAGGADWLHVDVMDGHFVPNITMGPLVIKAIRGLTGLPFCVHLMVDNPLDQVKPFADAGADYISFHLEVCRDCLAAIDLIHSEGKKAALAINPMTPLESAIPFLARIEMLVIMTVEPGKEGQEFMSEQLQKIREARSYIDKQGLEVIIEVDGGIKPENAGQPAMHGADVLVAGSSVFKHKTLSIAEAIAAIRKAADESHGDIT